MDAIRSIIVTLCVICSVTEAEEDGFLIYAKACKLLQSLEDKDFEDFDKKMGIIDEINNLREMGGSLNKELHEILKRRQPVFDLITEAQKKKLWLIPDITKADFQNYPSSYLTQWRTFNYYANLHARILLGKKKFYETYLFLSGLNNISNRLCNPGSKLQLLTVIGCRNRQIPILASAIDQAPVSYLNSILSNERKQYPETPSLLSALHGEYCMVGNTIDSFYRNLEKNMSESRKKAIATILEKESGEVLLHEIQELKLLSVEGWKKQATAFLEKSKSAQLAKFKTFPYDGIAEFDDAIYAEIEALDPKEGADPISSEFDSIFDFEDEEGVDIEFMKESYDRFGNLINAEFLSVTFPSISESFAQIYSELIAKERLLLIRVAARIYFEKNGQMPDRIQDLVETELLNGEMIIDPYSGNEFVVRDGFKVYSIGKDSIAREAEKDNKETEKKINGFTIEAVRESAAVFPFEEKNQSPGAPK